MRAIGLSFGKESPYIYRWSQDFNGAMMPFGAPAHLDSSSVALKLGTVVYTHLVTALPGSCQREAEGTSCSCTPSSIQEDFPSISISFETIDAFRVLGLDSGADTIVCIPPENYATYNPKTKRCNVAILDAGPRHVKWGYEQLVLGVPFFRSVAVVLDVQEGRVGIGPQLAAGPIAETDSSDAQPSRGEWSDSIDASIPATPDAIGLVQDCKCADPKNWWATGKRFSPRRVIVVLAGVAALGAYIYIAHSPSDTAESIRNFADNLCGGGGSSVNVHGAEPGNRDGLMGGSGPQRHHDDGMFVQMANRGGPE